jgi:hypothetical protein
MTVSLPANRRTRLDQETVPRLVRWRSETDCPQRLAVVSFRCMGDGAASGEEPARSAAFARGRGRRSGERPPPTSRRRLVSLYARQCLAQRDEAERRKIRVGSGVRVAPQNAPQSARECRRTHPECRRTHPRGPRPSSEGTRPDHPQAHAPSPAAKPRCKTPSSPRKRGPKPHGSPRSRR